MMLAKFLHYILITMFFMLAVILLMPTELAKQTLQHLIQPMDQKLILRQHQMV